MKKKTIAGFGLALAVPMLALSGCASMPAMSLNANWHASGNITTNITGTGERLEYAVTFVPAAETDSLSADYQNGVYTTSLTAEPYDLDGDGRNDETVYHLRTEFSIEGSFTVNGEQGEAFTDRTTSDVWFRNVTEGLQPLRSVKTVQSHTPNANPQDAESACTYYEYTYSVAYNADCTRAEIAIDYAEPADRGDLKTSCEIDGGGSYFDNEQILFALRGSAMTEAFSFRSINPVTRSVETVTASSGPSATSERIRFAIDGEGGDSDRTLNAYAVTIRYSGTNSGGAQDLVYAAKVTEGSSNTYRNVLLRMDVPVLEELGTLRYSLRNAVFDNK